MDVDWGTVSTSLLTSGGVLFAAYKLWFQRRLEDHKSQLQNNAKLFDMEMEVLNEFGKINQTIQNASIGIRAVLSNEELFIIKLTENISTMKKFREENSHLLSGTQMNLINNLIANYSKIQSEAKPFVSQTHLIVKDNTQLMLIYQKNYYLRQKHKSKQRNLFLFRCKKIY